MAEHSKAEWFRVQALQCIALALRAKDPRIKRLYALEADRWLRLTEVGSGVGAARSQVLERRTTLRDQSPMAGSILLERAFRVECVVRDVSSAGVGLLVPNTIILPGNFYLVFDLVVRRCITVWRDLDRMGVKVISTLWAWRPIC